MPEARSLVVIGASAGGLDALISFAAAIPARTGSAYLVIQHLSPDHPTVLPELLSRRATIPVVTATDGMELEGSTMYVVPPGKSVRAGSDAITLVDDESVPLRTIDAALDAAIESWGEQLVAVILSGTGADGSDGVRRVREAGGLVIAQELETAQFPAMPAAAEASGAVSISLPPHEIPTVINGHLEGVGSPDEVGRGEVPRDASMPALEQVLTRTFGIDFRNYKPSVIARRVFRRMQMLGLERQSEYLELIESDSDEAARVYSDVLIGVTEFVRDLPYFNLLREKAMPIFFQRIVEQLDPVAVSGDLSPSVSSQLDGVDVGNIRVWSCGCATGEEPYSLAMLFAEEARARGVDLGRIRIFATDVRKVAIDAGMRGVYGAESLRNVPPELVERYFVEEAGLFRVGRALRRMVIFAQHDLLQDPPYTQMDLVICRNLLIYMTRVAQSRAIASFTFGVRRGGVLFLGPSETLGDADEGFEPIDAKARIFRRTGQVLTPERTRAAPFAVPVVSSQQSTRGVLDRERERAYDALLAAYVPPSLLVSSSSELLHVFGDAREFLQVPTGRPARLVAELVVDDIRAPLSAALNRALRQSETVRAHATLEHDGEARDVHIVVAPVAARSERSGAMLVSFELAQKGDVVIEHASDPADPVVTGEAMQREEVAVLRSQLRDTVAELTENSEELQTANEELVVANEELQSTNEELHSVNEELYSLNAEHQRKIEDLEIANADVDNVLGGVDVGLIVLDRELRVRMSTRAADAMYHVSAADVGRPLFHLAARFDVDGVLDNLRSAVNEGVESQIEVETDDGSQLLVRVLPYRLDEDRVGGALLTSTDLTELKRAEVLLRQREHRFQQLAENIPDAFELEDLESGEQLYVNGSYRALYGDCDWLERVHPDDAERVRAMRDRSRSEADTSLFRLGRQAEGGKPVADWHWIRRRSFPVERVGPEAAVRATVSVDATIEVESNHRYREYHEQLREHSRLRDAILEASQDRILLFDDRLRLKVANRSACNWVGCDWKQIEGRTLVEIIDLGSPGTYLERNLRTAYLTGQRIESELMVNVEGDDQVLAYTLEPVHSDDEVVQVACTIRDVTRERALEAERLESEASLARLIEGIPVAAAFVGHGFEVSIANERFARLLGHTQKEIVGESVLDVSPRGLRETMEAPLRAAMDGRSVEYELEVPDDTGSSIKAIARHLPRTSAGGRVEGLFVIIEALGRRAAPDNAKDLQEQQQRESLGLLAGGVAHDFNNLLLAIIGNASMLRRKERKPVKEVGEILEAGRRAQELAEQLLAYAGRGRFDIADSDLSELTGEMAHLLRVCARGRARCELQLEERPCVARVDQRQVRQVLINLVTNASEAIADRGGKILIATGSTELSRHDLDVLGQPVLAAGRYVTMTVEDDGPGIPAEARERVLEPYYSTKTAGRGLGLAAVSGIVRAHDGFLTCDSEPGVFTRFVAYFPQVTDAREGAADGGENGAAEVDRATILVADDEVPILRLASTVLGAEGHAVEAAADGTEALAKLAAMGDRIDLVILDVTMPGCSGLEVYERLRADGHVMPVIVCSGYTDERIDRLAEDERVVFLKKPWDLDEFVGTVRRLLAAAKQSSSTA